MSRGARIAAAGAWLGGLLLDGTVGAAQLSPVTFKKLQLTDKFWSEGVAIADFDRDGHLDVASGPYWYRGPGFQQRQELFPATQTFGLSKPNGTQVRVEGYEGALGVKNAYAPVFLSFPQDFNGDGWPDILNIEMPTSAERAAIARWHENPGKAGIAGGKHWPVHVIFDQLGGESPAFVDLFDDGSPVILGTSGDLLGYVELNRANPRGRGTFHPISTPLPMLVTLRDAFKEHTNGKPFPYMHGLGAGDVDADGRMDVLEPEGWWEQPPSGSKGSAWAFHRWPFLQQRPEVPKASPPAGLTAEQGRELTRLYNWPYVLGGAQMYVYDVNGDGARDVISSLNAHGYGLAWFEQQTAAAGGSAQFVPRVLMDSSPQGNKHGVSFTQLHAVQLADVDGDGSGDIVTGKRFWAHGPGADPESEAPAVLYWFRLARSAEGRVDFVPYLIDDDSGVGTQFEVMDVTGDGLKDIITASKKGTFVFMQERKGAAAR